MNLMYATKNPDGTVNLGAACPRPLSRKKLKSLMRDNRKMLTSSALASGFQRTPGAGRTRSRFRQRLDRLEREQRTNPTRAYTLLGMLQSLGLHAFTRPATLKETYPGRKT